MKKDGVMPWIKIDVNIHDDSKILDAVRLVGHVRPHECVGVLVAAVGYASRHLTDGVVPVAALNADPSLIDAMVKVGLFAMSNGVIRVTKYNKWQRLSRDVLKKRHKNRVRQARFRAARGKTEDN